MHIQIVNFHLKGLSDEDYRKLCDEVAPAFAQVPGLIAKVFLANPGTNTYGGVYTWRDREAMTAFAGRELFAAVAGNPNLRDISSTDFAVLEGPSRATRGLVAVAA